MRAFAALFTSLLALASPPALTADGKIAVVAAQNFYGGIAADIGGDRVAVVSIISNPDQDPHLFETSPGTARQIADAKIVVVNGADYDPWMDKLLAAAPRSGRVVINAAKLVKAKPGDNPHLWYSPATMPTVAKAVAAALSQADPAHATEYSTRLDTTLSKLDLIAQKIAQMKAKHAGAPVTATEPIFGPMADALGLTMRNQRFQLAVMNDTEPSARTIAAFEDDLKQRKVKALIYNKQVTGKLTERLLDVAKKANVPAVGVTETQPPNVAFHDWMLGELDALDKALSGASS